MIIKVNTGYNLTGTQYILFESTVQGNAPTHWPHLPHRPKLPGYKMRKRESEHVLNANGPTKMCRHHGSA